MPVEIEWLNNGRVMFNTFTGRVTTNDILQSVTEHTDHAIKIPEPIHVIDDARQVTGLPVNILGLLQRDVPNLRNVKKGVYVVITQNRTIIVILNTFARLIPGTDFRFVRTPEAAWEIVNNLLSNEKSA